MHSSVLLTAFSALALARAQGIPGQDTIEGTPVYDGLPVPGTTGKLGDAAIVTDNPIGVTYTAILPDSTFSLLNQSHHSLPPLTHCPLQATPQTSAVT